MIRCSLVGLAVCGVASAAGPRVCREGRLTCGQLWAGLEWLGMAALTQEDIYAIMRYVDKSGVSMWPR